MAKLFMLSSKKLKSIICFFLLATTLANSARILDELTPEIPLPSDSPDPTLPPDTTIPQTPPVGPIFPTEPAAPIIAPVPNTTGMSASPIIAPIPDTTDTSAAPIIAPTPDIPNADVTTNVPAATTTGAVTPDHPTLSFFMHDILGGSHPSGRAVAGIIASSDANNLLPFSKPNNQIFPINGGVPLNTINGVINNNFPFLAGLNGSPTNTLVQSNGNNVVTNNNHQAFVTAGQLPQGLTVQQLMFGSVTVVDNQITEGHELDSSVLGRTQGFYLTSSTDGSSHTLALTAVFHGAGHEVDDDTVSFFGVHRTATPISHIAIVGGTGKYENAKGYATIETLPHEDQHMTDGVETITQFTLYLTP